MKSNTRFTPGPVIGSGCCVVLIIMALALAACTPPHQPPATAQPEMEVTVPRPTPTQPKPLPQPAVGQSPLPTTRETAPAHSPLPTPDEAQPTRPGSLGPHQLRDLAIADLASRLNIAPETIIVRAVESVDWSDASLGCPQPGYMYAQVITPGYRITLEAGGQTYAYHTSLRGIRFCAQP